MSFGDRAREVMRGRQGPECGIGRMLAQMKPDYRAEVEEALFDTTIFATVVVQLLAEDGYEARAESVQRHRRRQCACKP